MTLPTFRTGTILWAAAEKLPKEALVKNESYVSRSSVLIAHFHQVRVNQTLQGQHGEALYKTQHNTGDSRKESLIMSKCYPGVAWWKHTRGSPALQQDSTNRVAQHVKIFARANSLHKRGCHVHSCQIIVCIAVDFRLFLSYKQDRKTQRKCNLFTRTQTKGWEADRLLAYFINIPWEYSAHRCVSKEQQ